MSKAYHFQVQFDRKWPAPVERKCAPKPLPVLEPCEFESKVTEKCRWGEHGDVRECEHPKRTWSTCKRSNVNNLTADKICGECNLHSERQPPPPEPSPAVGPIIPAIAKFTERDLWPGVPGLRFNSSIIEHRDGYALAFRNGWKGSETFVGRLTRDLQPVGRPARLRLTHREANYGREDPRLFRHKGQLHVAYIGVKGGRRLVHTSQLFVRLSDEFEVEDVFYPHYPARREWEKNWQFFDYENSLYAVYSITPFRVLAIRSNDADLAFEHNWSPGWIGGEMRGGASPVRPRVPCDAPRIRRLVVRPREQAKSIDPGEPFIVISAFDFAGKPPSFKECANRKAVLSLRFQDFDPTSRNYGPDEKYNGVRVADQWMKQHHAREIWEFLTTHSDIGCVVVHCNEAVSRSPAIAMAVADGLGIPRNRIDWWNKYDGQLSGNKPVNNRHVYNTVTAAKPREWTVESDEFWCFFHDKIRGPNGKLLYRTGLMTFDAFPPFKPRRIIREPIMVADPATNRGSEQFTENYCDCIFTNGAVRDGERWILSSGVHDRYTELHEFNHAELESRLVEPHPGLFAQPKAKTAVITIGIGDRFADLARRNGQTVCDRFGVNELVILDERILNKFAPPAERFPGPEKRIHWLKFAIPLVCPGIERWIYADADYRVIRSPSAFVRQAVASKPQLLAVRDWWEEAPHPYYQAGFYVANRAAHERLFAWCRENYFTTPETFGDQCVWNAGIKALGVDVLELPREYNAGKPGQCERPIGVHGYWLSET